MDEICNPIKKIVINSMKKIIIVSIWLALAAISAQAQGTISFSNGSTTRIFTNNAVGGPAFSLTDLQNRYALFCSTTATSVNGQTAAIVGGASSNYAFGDTNWTLVAYGTNFLQPGLIVSASANGSGATTVAGVAGGSAAQFVVIGWSSNIGTDIGAVQDWFNGGNPAFNGWIGQSVVSGAITLGTSTPATLFGAAAPDIQGFTLGLVVPAASVPPVITAQPTNETVPAGAGASFSVSAYGTPTPVCQWMFNGTNMIAWATNFTLTISDVQSTNAGTYSAVITNSIGSTNSFAATLTVTAPSGDGYVIFDNYNSPSATKIYTNSAVGGTATGLTSGGGWLYDYALYASTNATSVDGDTSPVLGAASTSYAFNDTNWTLVAYGSNGTNLFHGQFLSLSANGAGPTPVPGFAPGTTASFVVIGWSANIGTNIADVQSWFNDGAPASNGWIGQSAVSGAIELGNGGSIPAPRLFGTNAPCFPGFTLGLASPNPGAFYVVPYAPPAVVQSSLAGNTLQLSWPAASGSFGVQSAPSPAGPWTDTGLTVTSDGSNCVVTNLTAGRGIFFRLVAQ
jgi:hypothetical protein